MIILDTNVISALMQSKPEPAVVAWLDQQPSKSIWTTSVSVFEIRFGLNILPDGQRRRRLVESFEQALRLDLENRVLDFDTSAAQYGAEIAARLRETGRPVEIRDVQIAGIIASCRGVLATRNSKHFLDTGVPLVDPWGSESG